MLTPQIRQINSVLYKKRRCKCVVFDGRDAQTPSDLTGNSVLPVVTVIEFVCQSQPHCLNWITQGASATE